jgi:L-threonylcarbamoyladenylate synthase
MIITLDEAASKLIAGEVVAIPTETVYGLAASVHLPEAIERIFTLKNRPKDNPLIIHVAEKREVLPYLSVVPERFEQLAEAFWPGPLTLVVPIDPSSAPPHVRAALPTQAFRIPAHPFAQALLKKTGPLAAPSANLSGRPSAVTPGHVAEDFGTDFPVLDGGKCTNGVESTILIWIDEKWALGRLGALSPQALMPVLGYKPELISSSTPLCPGQKYRHYAPAAQLHLGKDLSQASVILGFRDRKYSPHAHVIHWGETSKPEEVLRELYHCLRELDARGIREAHIDMEVPSEGLWLTFRERVQKASGNSNVY